MHTCEHDNAYTQTSAILSTTHSSGKREGEEAMNWPSLMYVLPSRSNSLRSTTWGGSDAPASRNCERPQQGGHGVPLC